MFLYLLNISLPFQFVYIAVFGCTFLGSKFMVPLYCGTCSLGVGLGWWLVKVSFLGELASVV